MERSKTLLNLTGFRAIRELASALAPHAHCFVALRGYPRHMNGIPAALRDAVFLAPASISPRQNGNASFDFAAFDAAHRNAIYASGAFAGVYHGIHFSHGMSVVGRFPPIISR